MDLFDLHSPQPTDDKVSRQPNINQRRHTDEATEQRELEEAMVDNYENNMDTTLYTSATERAAYLDKHPPDMKEYGKTMKTFSALTLMLLLTSCISIAPKGKTTLYNYYDVEGNRHIFQEDLYKIKETSHYYCYEHDTLHELVVYNVPNNEALMKVISQEEASLPEGDE